MLSKTMSAFPRMPVMPKQLASFTRKHVPSLLETTKPNVVVGQHYMRSRTMFALASALNALSALGLSEYLETIKYIASNITDLEVMRLIAVITHRQPIKDSRLGIQVFSTTHHFDIHISCMGHKLKQHDIDAGWSRLHRSAPNMRSVMASIAEEISVVTAQAGDMNATGALSGLKSALKRIGTTLKKFASSGIAGRLIIYIALLAIAARLIKFVPRWVIVALITCAEFGWIGRMGRDVAECIPDEDPDGVPPPAPADPYDCLGDGPTVRWQKSYAFREEFYGDAHEVIPQSALITTAVAFGFSTMIGRKVPLYSKIVNAQKFKAGIEDIVKGAEGAFESLANLILKAFGSKRVIDLNRHQSITKKFASSVDTFDVEVRAMGRDIDDDAFQRFAGMIAHGEEALTHWPRDSDEWRMVKKAMGVLTKLSCDYPAHFNSAKARVEPIGLMLAGPPGMGKTSLIRLIAKLIARHERPDEEYDMARHTFQKPTGPYYEGYKGQLVFCMDDVFTKQPVAGEQDGDAETIVKIINQWPLALNMANCALKGRFYMTSPYVIATTNLTQLAGLSKAVVDAQAIVRRFPLWFDVKLREGQQVTAGCNPDDTWIFHKKDFSGTGNDETTHTFTEVIGMLFEERARRAQYHETSIATDDFCDNLLARFAKKGNAHTVTAQGNPFRRALPIVGRTAKVFAAGLLGVKAATMGVAHVINGVKRRVVREIPQVLDTVRHVAAKSALHLIMLVAAIALSLKVFGTLVGGAVGMLIKPFTRSGNGEIIPCTKMSNGDLYYQAPTKVNPQGGIRDEVLELVQRNMFNVYCDDVRLGYAFALDDMCITMPAHFVEISKQRGRSLVIVGRRQVPITLTTTPHVDAARDLAYFRVKTMCKDVGATHISDHPNERNLLLVRYGSVEPCSTTLEPRIVKYDGTGGLSTQARVMHVHSAKTAYGDCGAIIMGATGKGGRRIYGMHTALDHNERPYSGCYTTFGFRVKAQSGETFCGHRLIETLDRPVHNGGDTRLEPTPYAGLHGPLLTAPSAKRPVNGVDPMLKAVAGYKRDWPEVPESVASCVSAVVSEIFESIKGHNLGPTSIWEAASGLPGEPYSKGLARSKSPGYPFLRKYSDKKAMLGADGPYVKGPAYQELEDAVNKLAATYREGGQGAIYRDSLKDEPRTHAKVAECKTRMISGCPVELAVLGRTQTLRFTSALMQTRHEHGIMPGFNPYSIEASQLFQRLAFVNKDNHASAGDYKEFDKTQHPKIMGDIWAKVSAKLVEHGCDAEILAGLGRDTFGAYHLGGNCYSSDKVYQVDGTLPSGHWMTSFLNSIYNAVVLRYCWVKYKGNTTAAFDFLRHVAAVYYGDDFLMAADDDNRGFDLTLLQKYVVDLGMTMTDENGDYGGAPSKHITEVSFLCRKFRIGDDNRVWMPLSLDSIDDMHNWKKRSTNIQEHTEAIVRAALTEASAHDMVTFTRYYRACQDTLSTYIPRMAELQLPLGDAYAHWQNVHKQHVPVWSPDDDDLQAPLS